MNVTSKYKGVEFVKSANKLEKPWRAYITVSGSIKYLGNFETETLAAEAYNEVAYARGKETNFIREVIYLKEGEEYV
jgi:hypothetical protein